MTENPYRIKGPASISFSGGRTSAYMLKLILDAHGGTLPDDVHVCFANTGKEREETLRFVHDCATRWGVPVRWLEWRPKVRGAAPETRYAEVDYNSADREGVWFAELIRRKQYLPNPIIRYCTIELKIRVIRDFMLAHGHKNWTNAVGLRADEMHRVFKAIERNETGKERFRTVMPMASCGPLKQYGRTELEVRRFWAAQPFDLILKPHEGNCDLCFLKGRNKRAAIIRNHSALANWWIQQEETVKCSKSGRAKFRKDETYRQLVSATLDSPLLPISMQEADEFDAECGLWCPGEAA